jgi:hypothetical protein
VEIVHSVAAMLPHRITASLPSFDQIAKVVETFASCDPDATLVVLEYPGYRVTGQAIVMPKMVDRVAVNAIDLPY